MAREDPLTTLVGPIWGGYGQCDAKSGTPRKWQHGDAQPGLHE